LKSLRNDKNNNINTSHLSLKRNNLFEQEEKQ